ncbi:MAG: response regulator [Burkholderiaceae bacterium]|nr:response regulator [Burkholderiaceae bacterium]
MLAPIQNLLLYGLVPLLVVLALIGAALLYAASRRRREPEFGTDAPESELDSGDPALATTVPALPAAAMPGVDPRPGSPGFAADLLLVDDSAVARAKLRRLFETCGYRAQVARDGVEALALLDKGRYRLMITDLEMPNLDGVGLIGECLRLGHAAAMPILAITGHDDLQDRLDACHQISGIHRKPWIDDDLVGHVSSLVGRAASHTDPALAN